MRYLLVLALLSIITMTAWASMTAQVSVTNVDVSQPSIKYYTFQLTVTDSNGPGFTKTYAYTYTPFNNLTEDRTRFINSMQSDIDDYKLSRQIMGSASLASAIAFIQGSLTL